MNLTSLFNKIKKLVDKAKSYHESLGEPKWWHWLVLFGVLGTLKAALHLIK